MPRKKRFVVLLLFLTTFCFFLLNQYLYFSHKEEQEQEQERVEERFVICQKVNSVKPYLIFVLGAEGTGHHLFEELAKEYEGIKQFESSTIIYLTELWEPATSDEEREDLKKVIQQDILKLISNDAGNHTYLAQKTNMFSVPFNGPRNTLRRPDLMEIFDLFQEYFNIRFIVMFRNPINSIASLIKRNWWGVIQCVKNIPKPYNTQLYDLPPLEHNNTSECGHVHVQARVVEDSLIYIQYQLKAICSDMYRVVHYEDFTEDPLGYAKPLSQFAQLELEPLQRALEENVHKAGNHSSFQTDEQLLLDDIFNSFKQNQWIFLLDQQINLKNYQAHNPSPLSYQETVYKIYN